MIFWSLFLSLAVRLIVYSCVGSFGRFSLPLRCHFCDRLIPHSFWLLSLFLRQLFVWAGKWAVFRSSFSIYVIRFFTVVLPLVGLVTFTYGNFENRSIATRRFIFLPQLFFIALHSLPWVPDSASWAMVVVWWLVSVLRVSSSTVALRCKIYYIFMHMEPPQVRPCQHCFLTRVPSVDYFYNCWSQLNRNIQTVIH